MWLGTATIVSAALVVVVGWASPALGAPRHGGPGEMSVVTAEPSADGGAVHLEVAITYIGDGEAAERASVSVSGATPDGQTTGPVDVTMTDVVGTYAADVPVPGPGDWTFSVISTFPPATLDVPVTVDDAAATGDTSATSDTDATAETVADTVVDTTTAEPTTAEAATADASGVAAPSIDETDDDDGLGPVEWLVIAVVVLAVASGAAYALRRRGA
jgi:hypothetical protein